MKPLIGSLAFALAVLPALGPASDLPVLGKAHDLIGHDWRNSGGLTLAGLKGKVVVVHFWTLACINCKHNLPSYNRWEDEFEGKSFQIVGIHTPELPFEREPARLDEAIRHWHIRYPVLSDPEGRNWDAWKQEYWPTVYLIDKRGRIRDTWQGELNYDNQGGEQKLAAEIRELIAEPYP